MLRLGFFFFFFFLFPLSCLAQSSSLKRVEVRIESGEAKAVLAILARKKAGEPILDTDWQRVFSSEGYIRLKKRELAMNRPFEEETFKKFVLSEQLGEKYQVLAETLAKWETVNVNQAARKALAYLPKAAHIQAKIYPVIKPTHNSFVFEINTDPAIFLYLDPAVSTEQFENTLAHELHHIGYGSACPSKQGKEGIARLSEPAQTVLNWAGAFGEGFAMLAAAGGPTIHPHAVSPLEDRTRWDRDVSHFNDDLKKVETFFLNMLATRLTKQEQQTTGFSFFGVQGPWYTVGWKMAVVIEETSGRKKLIECMCDQRQLLQTFNHVVGQYNRRHRQSLTCWSPALLEALEPPSSKRKSP